MRRTISIPVPLIILTIINIGILIFHDHFHYKPYASYESLYDDCDDGCIKKWSLFRDDYPSAELQEAKRISDSVIGLRDISTTDKILKIAGFVHQRFIAQSGRPSIELLNASPLKQYKMLCASDTLELWCGNFAAIFSYFCWSEGIVTRNIEILNPSDHHIVSECYIPETRKWALIDPTNNLLQLKGNQGILNLQSFIQAIQKNVEITVLKINDTLAKSSLDTATSYVRNYYNGRYPCYYYHRIDNKKAYRLSNKIKEYFLPVSWHEIYDNNNKGNFAFYLKVFFILFWLISFFVFILRRTKFRK